MQTPILFKIAAIIITLFWFTVAGLISYGGYKVIDNGGIKATILIVAKDIKDTAKEIKEYN